MAQPLDLILARNLLSVLETPAVLVDGDGALVFYNVQAGALVCQRFEDRGRLELEEWTREFGPLDDSGQPVSADDLPLRGQVRDGRPASGRFGIRSARGTNLRVDVTAMPLVGVDGYHGAIVLFAPVQEAD